MRYPNKQCSAVS